MVGGMAELGQDQIPQLMNQCQVLYSKGKRTAHIYPVVRLLLCISGLGAV